MNAFSPCHPCLTPWDCGKACTCLRGSSAEGASELKPQPARCALATGSLPASSADFFYGWLRARAAKLNKDGISATVLYYAAEDFRRDMGLPKPRQPEENGRDEPRPLG